MAEIRTIVCDVCGKQISEGSTFTMHRRTIDRGVPAPGGRYRFDMCGDCFSLFVKLTRQKDGRNSLEKEVK